MARHMLQCVTLRPLTCIQCREPLNYHPGLLIQGVSSLSSFSCLQENKTSLDVALEKQHTAVISLLSDALAGRGVLTPTGDTEGTNIMMLGTSCFLK